MATTLMAVTRFLRSMVAPSQAMPRGESTSGTNGSDRSAVLPLVHPVRGAADDLFSAGYQCPKGINLGVTKLVTGTVATQNVADMDGFAKLFRGDVVSDYFNRIVADAVDRGNSENEPANKRP